MIDNIKNMLSEYDLNNVHDIRYPFAEILQKCILVSLSKIGFFENVAFCGGTSLRIFYGLQRFSEDLDFNLIDKTKKFEMDGYIDDLITQMNSFGVSFVKGKIKKNNAIHKVFLSTNLYDLLKKYCDKKYWNSVRDNETLKIKIEVDINSPINLVDNIEDKILYEPQFAKVKVLKKDTLFSGKLNAILTRPTTDREAKGRDYYDYVFYIATKTSPNLNYLQYSLSQFNMWDKNKKITLPDLKKMLTNNFKKINMENLKSDVRGLIKSDDEIDHWTSDMFLLTLKDLY